MKDITLFDLSSKKRLVHFFHYNNLQDLKKLTSDECYNIIKIKSAKKFRICEVPCPDLFKVHELVFNELQKKNVPHWLFSSKGKGYIANAKFHAESGITYLLKMDISKFYPSCKKVNVFNLFRDKKGYGLPGDISELLADILTYNGHIPTGSPVSALLAFWSYYDCFNEIYLYSKANDFKMSLYVDDITLSGKKEPSRLFVNRIKNIIKRYGLQLNSSKLKLYKPYRPKLVTGVIIKPSGNLSVPNKLRKKIFDLRKEIREQQNNEDLPKALNRLNGLKNSAFQIQKHNPDTNSSFYI